jgi:hypothetical protein
MGPQNTEMTVQGSLKAFSADHDMRQSMTLALPNWCDQGANLDHRPA